MTAHLLNHFMQTRRVTLEQMAEDLGCTFGHIGHLRAGRRRPSLRLALAIERVTGIPVASWEALPSAPPRPRGRRPNAPRGTERARGVR